MAFVGIATVVNIVLYLIFVGPMGMNTAGAAIATVIAQVEQFYSDDKRHWLQLADLLHFPV